MIELIGTDAAVHLSRPCKVMLEYLDKLLADDPGSLTVAEIGVGFGATSVEIVKRLRECDTYHFFSFQDEVDELYDDLVNLGCTCKLVPFGNSRLVYDSYCWPLAKLALDTNSDEGIYDLVFLDGGHNLNWTGLGCALLKTLIKPGGYIVFDDLAWSYDRSIDLNPRVAPEMLERYTEEQLRTTQVQMVVDIFMVRDSDWLCEEATQRYAVFRRKLEKEPSVSDEVEKLKTQILAKDRLLIEKEKQIRDALEQIRRAEEKLRAKRKRAQRLDNFKSSRVGQTITYIPDKIRHLFKRT